MMLEMQILKTFSNRTEYKVLRQWASVKEMDLMNLAAGYCVIPAVVLSKMALEESVYLVNWAKIWGNQLLIFPPFHTIVLKDRLQLGVEINVKRVSDSRYEGIPLKEIFITNCKPKLQLASGEVIAMDVFFHSGSGQVTMTTLPLLDYRLLLYEEKCKEIFLKLLADLEIRTQDDVKLEPVELNPLQQNVIVLAAAGINSTEPVIKILRLFFNITIDEETIKTVKNQLQVGDYLAKDGGIALKGQEFILQRGYRAFVRELAKYAAHEGEW